jgi:hypothetical protein
MSKNNSKSVQVNILMPVQWKEQLEDIARKRAYQEKRTFSYIQIVRDLIKAFLEKSCK